MYIYGGYFHYSWYARIWIITNQDERFRFGFYCNSSLNENNSSYNVLCKYHPSPNDSKFLPKRPQVATERCFRKLNSTKPYNGVSEHHNRFDFCNIINLNTSHDRSLVLHGLHLATTKLNQNALIGQMKLDAVFPIHSYLVYYVE